MRRIILGTFSLYLLAAVHSGSEVASAPSDKAKVLELRFVKNDAPLTQVVGWINENLRDLYIFVREQHENLDRAKVIEQLRTQLDALVNLDAAIRTFGDPRNSDNSGRILLLHDRAESFIYAWATFSRLTIDASQNRAAPDDRKALLDLKGSVGKESPLRLLLTLYANIRAAEGVKQDPLRARLEDGFWFPKEFAYNHPWKEKEKPHYVKHNRYIPSTADLIGNYDATPALKKENREILSLWALVNLQLDTWRDEKPAQSDTLGLTALAQWLKDFSNTDLLAFDGKDKRGSALNARLAKLHLFIDFRDRHTNLKGLKNLLTELGKPDRQNRSPADTEAIKHLVEAAEPIDDNELLPQAGVWLRYVVLLSYQREGVQVVAGRSLASLKNWWAKLQKNHSVGDFRTGLKPAKPVVDGFVRWNAWPEQGHIIRVFADATDAAYRYALWEVERPNLEINRYKSAVITPTRNDYVNKLREHVKKLDSIYADNFERYFVRKTPESFDEWLFPHPTVPVHSSSLNDLERKRIENDLTRLAAITTSANQVQKAILAAYEAKDPAAVSTWLQGPATTDGMARWTPFDLPQKPFREYYRQVMDSVQRLKGKIEDEQKKADLTQLYNEQVEANDILADEVAIARLGLEIAEQGKQVADCFKQLAALDKQIADLAKDWSKLEDRAKKLHVKKAELQLGLAAQARELAAAKLEGLKEALARVDQLVKNATAQLESMKPRLLEAAKKIEKQKRNSSIFSILRSIVTVVGAVLTPFVGPEAIQIATTVNQALTIAENASDINFDNLGDAIKGLDKVASNASQIANFAIDHWGSKDLKKVRDDVNQWLRNNRQSVDRLTGDAKKNVEDALNKIKALKETKAIEAEVQKLRNFVSEIGSGLPISLDKKGSVKIDVGKLAVQFSDKTELKKLLEKVFQEGGMVVNTLRSDAERIAVLTGLDNDKRKQALLAALDEVIRTSPPELLDRLGKRDYDSAREKVNRSREDLKKWVEKVKADDAALKLLGQALGSGMTIVKDDQGRIIALSPAIKKEMEAFRERVKAFKKQWEEQTIKKFINEQIQPKFDDIKKQSDAAQNAKDDKSLARIAEEKIPQAITQLQKDFKELSRRIEIAQGELKDAETNLEIATIDRDAAMLLSDASAKRKEAAALGVEEAMVKERIAAIDITKAGLMIQQKELEVLAAAKRLALNEEKLRHIYANCRRSGVDPDKPKENAQLDELSLLAILDVENKTLQRGHAYYLDKAAQGAVGMVQWLRLLNVPRLPEKGAKESQAKPLPNRDQWALDMVRSIIDIRHRRDAAITLANNFKQSADNWNDLFLEQASVPDEHLGFARAVGIRGDKIVWFDEIQPTDRLRSLPSGVKEIQALTPDLATKMEKLEFLHQVPERGPLDTMKGQRSTDLRRKTLGYFKFRFTLDEHDDRGRSPDFAEVQVAPDPSSSYYFLLGDTSLVHERKPGVNPFPVVNLRFLVVPPDNPVGNPSLPFTGALPNHHFLTKQLNDPLEETILLGQIRQRLQLWKKLQLTGAVGDWAVYILATDVPNEAKRLERIAKCRKNLNLTFRIPYIEVPAR